MLFGGPNAWGYRTGNVEGVRKAAAFGTAVTPSATANTYGAYVSLVAGTSIVYDCYHITICINNIGVSGVARDAICTIGIDPTGGTSYTDWIPNLLCGEACSHLVSLGGSWYSFPLFVKAGSRIGAKLAYNLASGTAGSVAIWLTGQPRNPAALDVGYRGVEAIGVTTATSSGTVVTPGTTSQGAWTSLGTSVNACKYWNLGVGINDSSVTAFTYSGDAATGNATNKHIIVPSLIASTLTTETMSFRQPDNCHWYTPASANIYGRLWCSGAGGDSNLSLAAYGVII